MTHVRIMTRTVLVLGLSMLYVSATAGEINITALGATPDDDRDDTTAIEQALALCAQRGGGSVLAGGANRVGRCVTIYV